MRAPPRRSGGPSRSTPQSKRSCTAWDGWTRRCWRRSARNADSARRSATRRDPDRVCTRTIPSSGATPRVSGPASAPYPTATRTDAPVARRGPRTGGPSTSTTRSTPTEKGTRARRWRPTSPSALGVSATLSCALCFSRRPGTRRKWVCSPSRTRRWRRSGSRRENKIRCGESAFSRFSSWSSFRSRSPPTRRPQTTSRRRILSAYTRRRNSSPRSSRWRSSWEPAACRSSHSRT
mmetsp:Transcript_3488/g.14067  ORF Transcript_3488/g.14067 Transcript_3488/m.14067 type:complete len:235 (-) Transcript_3488:545-1249(-)